MTQEHPANLFGDLLRHHRKKKNLQLGQFAQKLGLPPSVLSDVELGRRQPFRHEVIERCADILLLTSVEVEALIAAASRSRGAFELAFDAAKPRAVAAAAALTREWPSLSDKAYDEIVEVVRRSKNER